MKGILEFSLPEDAKEFEIAQKGSAWKSVCYEVDMWLRNKIKYEKTTETETKIYQSVRAKLYEEMNEEGLSRD